MYDYPDLPKDILELFAERAINLTQGTLQELTHEVSVTRKHRNNNEFWKKRPGPPPILDHKKEEVVALYQSGVSTPQLAEQYKVGRQVIKRLVGMGRYKKCKT